MIDETQDPLAADVGDKDLTKMPLIPADKKLRFEIRKPAKVTSKSNPTVKFNGSDVPNEMINVPCHLTEDTRAVDGSTINKGFPIFHRIMVTVHDERTPKQVASDVGRLCQAVGLQGVKVIDVINNPSLLDGKIFDAKTKINKEKDGYPESNSLSPIPLG